MYFFVLEQLIHLLKKVLNYDQLYKKKKINIDGMTNMAIKNK